MEGDTPFSLIIFTKHITFQKRLKKLTSGYVICHNVATSLLNEVHSRQRFYLYIQSNVHTIHMKRQ